MVAQVLRSIPVISRYASVITVVVLYAFEPMSSPLIRAFCIVALLATVCVPQARSQEKCSVPIPSIAVPPQSQDIFTPQQEVYLGDVQAEQIERNLHVIQDDKLTKHMDDVLNRLVAQLPPTGLKFRVILIDLPVVNSMSIAGGRIYVTRKMVAFVQNDDELAGLLAHEMGHALAHQTALTETRLFRQILGVTSVGDRQDIFDKFNRLIDNIGRNPKLLERLATEEEPDQYQADRIAVAVMANAGYAPESFASFFDRFAQTNGKTGNWLTDLFTETTINEKRLREIKKTVQELPPTCLRSTPAPPSTVFEAWQATVVGYSDLGRREKFIGLMDQRALTPPLRTDLTNVRFSPDGEYLLAQDDASIFVLSHDPLQLLFRVDARDSYPAQFAPDSRSVVFNTRGWRVERWSVPDGNQLAVHELAVPKGCIQGNLSPDGRIFACLNNQFDLSLIDTDTGTAVFAKKHFFVPTFELLLQALLFQSEGLKVNWARLEFSPDSHIFLASGGSSSLAIDLRTDQPSKIDNGLAGKLQDGSFAFLAPDRVVVVNEYKPQASGVFEFPSGHLVESVYLHGTVRAPTRGNYIIAGPLKDFQVGALDLSAPEKFTIAVRDSAALDIYGDQAATQAASGQIVLALIPSLKTLAVLPLPQSPLGVLRAADVSPDLKWLAVSGGTRGGVWNVDTGERLYFTRGFRGAYFDDSALFADFPKLDQQVRAIARMDLNGGGVRTAFPVEDDPKELVRQWGRYLVKRRPAGKNGSVFVDTVLEVDDARDGHMLWSRTFPKEMPEATLNPKADTLLIGWPADSDAAKRELKLYPALKSRLAAMKDKFGAYLLEDINAATGHQLGEMVMDTGRGSFGIEDAYAAGDFIVVFDNRNRTLVYSLSTGEQKSSYFGNRSILSTAANLLSIENQPGELDIYALGTEQQRCQLTFSSPVALQEFSDDGKRLFVLTANQTEYIFDSATLAKGSAANGVGN